MDRYVRQSIDARRDAIFNAYEVGAGEKKKVDLFTEIATKAQPKAVCEASAKGVGKMVAGGVAAGVAESAIDQAVDNVVPTRAAVHQKASDVVRDIPVVGDAIDIGQKASYLGHLGKLFKDRKKK